MKRNLKVFIVDDEPAVVEQLVDRMEWDVYGYEVAGFSTKASETLKYIETHAVDLLLTDICMPEMSGLELVKRVKEICEDIFVVVVSVDDGFSTVKEAFQYGIVDYCLKPIDKEELQECLKMVQKAYSERLMNCLNQDSIVYRNGILQRLISGETNTYQLDKQCGMAGIALHVPCYQIGIIDTGHMSQESVLSVLRRINGMQWEGLHCFLDTEMNLVMLFFREHPVTEEEEKEIQEILRREGVFFDSRLVMGKPLYGYQQIAVSYQVCCDFLQTEFLFFEKVIHTEKYPYEKYLEGVKNKNIQMLLGELNARDHTQAVRRMGRIIETSPSTLRREEIICLAVILQKYLRKNYILDEMPAQKMYLAQELSWEKMLEWVTSYYMEAANYKKEEKSFYHPYVDLALREIHDHYAEPDFSLQTVALLCHSSSVYVGRLFKEQTGEYFNEYLCKYRLEVAENLLSSRKMRICDISSAVGFSYQSYFNKMFRKVYGFSPAEYRHKNQQEQGG